MKHLRIIAVLIILTFISFYIFTLAYNAAKQQAIQQLYTQEKVIAKQTARALEDYFTHSKVLLTILSSNEHIINIDKLGIDLVQKAYKINYKDVAGITRMDETGKIIYSYPNTEVIGQSIIGQKHIQKILKTHSPVLSDVINSVQGFRTVTLHIPVFENNKFTGSLAFLIPFETITEKYLNSIQIGESGYAFMIDAQGTTLYNPAPKYIGKSIYATVKDYPEFLTTINCMVVGKEGKSEYDCNIVKDREYKLVHKYAYYAPIKIEGSLWSICITTPEFELLKFLQNFTNKWLWALLSIICLMVASIYLLISYLIKIKREEVSNVAQEQIIAERNKAQLYLDTAETIIMSLDIDGNIVMINRKGLDVFGYSKEIMIGSNFYDEYLDYTQRQDIDKETFSKIMNGEITLPTYNENVITTKNNGLAEIAWYNNMLIENGKIVGVITSGEVVTQRNANKKALEAAHQQLRDLVNAVSQSAIISTDMNGIITTFNQGAELMLGYKASELIGKHTPKLFHLESEISVLSDNILAKTGKKITGFPVFVYNLNNLQHSKADWTYVRKDGTKLTVDLTITCIFNSDGEISGYLGVANDITLQRDIQSKLIESEKKYRLLFENMTSGFAIHRVIYDEEDNIIDYEYTELNPAFGKIMGRQIDTMIGKKVFDFFNKSELPWINKYASVAKTGEPQSHVEYFQGINKYLDVYAFSTEKDVFAVVVNDVTERVQAQELLQKNAEQLKNIITNVDVVNFAINSDGIFTLSEGRALEKLGLSPGQLVGLSVYEDYKEHPDIIESVKKCLDGNSLEILVKVRNLYFETRYTPVFNSENQVTGLLGVAIDITQRKNTELELKESEEKLSKIVNNSSNVILITRIEDGKILFANDSIVSNFGYEKDEIIGKTVNDINLWVNKGDRAKYIEQLNVTGEIKYFEFNTRKKNGEIMTCLNSASITEMNGEKCIISIITNITDRIKSEQEKETLIQKLENKNSELERFTYTVSHDLKSPIITIKSFAGMIKNDLDNNKLDRVQNDLLRINTAADNMAHLLQDLLELSRIGRIVNPSSEFKITDIANEVIETLYGALEVNNVQVKIIECSTKVIADKVRIKEVIQNLVENAIKFFGDQPNPCIEIGGNIDQGCTTYYVKDNGIGIEAKYLDSIFGLFHKLDSSTEGTGIGLSLVKRIIQFHNGDIWVESKPGSGSTFFFTIGYTKNLFE